MLPAVHTTLVAMVSPNQYQEFGTDWSWDGETITKAFPIGVIHFSGLFQVTPTSPVLLQKTDNEASDTVEPLYNGHFGTSHFWVILLLYRGFPFSEVKMY